MEGRMMNSAIERAVAKIWEGYSEPLSLSDIANSAILSRFHFSRVFRDATGVSPVRFLFAVRIYQAKRLLASTSLSVTDISLAVGYNSLGSFTNRFTDSVGASPTRFRRMCRDGIRPFAGSPGLKPGHDGTVSGAVSLPAGYRPTRVFVGVFQTPIIQCRPLSSTIVEVGNDGPAHYRLPDVPPGDWFVRAVAAADSTDPEPWTRRSMLIGGRGPVPVSSSAATTVDIAMRPRLRTDLPILFAIPDLEPHGTGAFDESESVPADLQPVGAFAAAVGR
jgi:AraC family transcriptional regulator